ncbi:5'-methylthioadenosine nucleosidase-like [Juglans microcarpa x Juglans regia]|uniref:5'-methylthioadenosine nucleosidase-like n=1 Tax=Juglans microcarpa x Juglans regia TaxID=2249226 RepID=UPI001B7DC708|nr:5'-methylthioadenosine nucleosidase-like [Juglans microcarpa x Juglans regia]
MAFHSLSIVSASLVNASIAGGFKAKGAGVGDVFRALACASHDRRIPILVFDMNGVGLHQASSSSSLLKELNLKVGKLSIGDSLAMSPQDEISIIANDVTIKDMEGVDVAHVADLLKVTTNFVKATIDIVDGEKPTAKEFLQHLVPMTAAFGQPGSDKWKIGSVNLKCAIKEGGIGYYLVVIGRCFSRASCFLTHVCSVPDD